jgi:hypothetical protein
LPTKQVTGFALLQQPFDKSVVESVTKKITRNGKKVSKTFKNVDPIHYLDRLNEAFPDQYNLEYGNPLFAGGKAVSVNAKVTFYPGTDDERILAANGAHPIYDAENPDDVAYAVKSAQSDALKLALKPTGLGRELYDKNVDEAEDEVEEEVEEEEEPDEKPARRARNTSRTRKPDPEDEDEDEEEAPPARRRSGGNGDSDWGSKRNKFTIPIGKHKGAKYAKIEQGWLAWYLDNVERDEKKNGKVFDCINDEVKYRKDNDLWEASSGRGGSKPVRKRNVGDDYDD